MATETVGLIGSIIVLLSMCFKPYTYSGNMIMRILNFVGSIVYIYYGIRLSAYSIIALNIILTFVNLFYIYKAIKYKYKEK